MHKAHSIAQQESRQVLVSFWEPREHHSWGWQWLRQLLHRLPYSRGQRLQWSLWACKATKCNGILGFARQTMLFFQIGNLCYRPSSYPLTFDEAQSRCLSEGGFLAPVTSEAIQTELAELIRAKIDKLRSFQDSKKFWIDGIFDTRANTWSWNNSREIFSMYNNWRYGISSKLWKSMPLCRCISFAHFKNFPSNIQLKEWKLQSSQVIVWCIFNKNKDLELCIH